MRIDFDRDGFPVRSSSPSRPRAVGGETVPTPWGGVFADPRAFGPVVLPARAEVAWEVDGRWTPYWRGTVTGVS